MAHPVKLRGGHLGGQREIDLEIIFPDTDILGQHHLGKAQAVLHPQAVARHAVLFQLDLQ